MLILQTISGIFLSIHYSADITTAFQAISHISRDVNNGLLIRAFHANGARIIFIALYIHIARGIYYKSFINKET
ncbi:hypothetical protein JQN64_24690 [Escherichia coli]|nr:hypothetical protein [Escherichia coli]